MILEVNEIHTFYGASQILFGISLAIERGEVVCLLGRNGAGKTTTLRSIMGLTPPRSGSIKFRGEEITGKRPFQIARRGVGYVPDDRRIFADLTVLENLEVARKRPSAGSEEWTIEKIYRLFPVLKERARFKGGHLSGGEQQMLTIARTLMGNPELLLLDEPSEGLSPLVMKELERQIHALRERKITVLLAEQNSKFAMKVGERAYIIEKGLIRYQGSIDHLRENEEIRRAYLAV